MNYLTGYPKVIFQEMMTDILEDKPKDVEGWMLDWISKNKHKLKRECLAVRNREVVSDSEDEEEKEERLRAKQEREARNTIEINEGIIEEEDSGAESYGQGEPDPEPNF